MYKMMLMVGGEKADANREVGIDSSSMTPNIVEKLWAWLSMRMGARRRCEAADASTRRNYFMLWLPLPLLRSNSSWSCNLVCLWKESGKESIETDVALSCACRHARIYIPEYTFMYVCLKICGIFMCIVFYSALSTMVRSEKWSSVYTVLLY